MLNAALIFAFVCIGLALLLSLVRLVRGPGLADRILALDTMYINTIALLIVYGIHADLAIFFEAALLIALMGFISTVAFTAVHFSEGTQASGVETYTLDKLRYAVAPAAVPTPAALGLFGMGLIGLGMIRRKA